MEAGLVGEAGTAGDHVLNPVVGEENYGRNTEAAQTQVLTVVAEYAVEYVTQHSHRLATRTAVNVRQTSR